MRARHSAAAAVLAAALLPPGTLVAAPAAQQAQGPKGAAPAPKHAKPTPRPEAKRPAPQPEAAPEFTLPPGPRVTLAEAIATTLERDPRVETARQELRRLRGVVREASGRFDPVFTLGPSLQREKTHLTASALQPEINKRQFLADSSANLSRIASEIASNLTDKNGFPFPDCKGSQYYVNGFPICTQNISPTDYRTFQLLQDAQNQTAGSNTTDKLQQAITQSVNRRLTEVVALIRRVFLPAITTQLVNIGDLPTEEEVDTLNWDMRLQLPFRNGAVVAPVFYMQGTRYAFSDKPDSPAYGGTGVPTLYRTVLGLSADVPLLRGGGRESAGAEEMSARLRADAAAEQLAQAGADATLNTTIAYWNLAAAQELQKLLTKGAGSQKRIGDLSRALVQGDELPRADLTRVDAQTLETEASALEASRQVAYARVELARAMGLDILRIEEAPVAADPLPAPADVRIPDAKGVDAAVAGLVDLRGDVRAARKQVDAARVVERAARLDLRPRLDLSAQLGWNAFYEDTRFELQHVWNATGYWRSWQESWVGPSATLSVALSLPIGNNTQKGRLVTAESFRSEAEITARDIERQAVNEARSVAVQLPSAAADARAREVAAAESDKIVGAAYERFRAGETRLMDAILSERSRIQAQADLVAARQTLALRAARLQWAEGTLLPVDRSGGEVRFGVPGAR